MTDHFGGYRFLPGIAPYSCGVVSAEGFEIVHVTLSRIVPWREGFARIEAFLAAERRPKAALCAVELRSPKPFTFEGFATFNDAYAAVLKDWGLFVDEVNPVARTNVAPERFPPSEPSLYAFSYSRPSEKAEPTFIVAGAGELPEGVLAAGSIVAAGDVSPEGIARKAAFVIDLMERRLKGLGGDWAAVTTADVYTVHPFDRVLPVLIQRMGRDAPGGVHWHYTRPPIEGIEFEMDLRGVHTELRL